MHIFQVNRNEQRDFDFIEEFEQILLKNKGFEIQEFIIDLNENNYDLYKIFLNKYDKVQKLSIQT